MGLNQEQVKSLCDRKWDRLNSLYTIKNKEGKAEVIRFNRHQRRLLKRMANRNTIPKARQLGFTTAIDIYFLDTCIWTPNTNAGIIADSKVNAAEIFEEKVRYTYDRLAPEIKELAKARIDRAGELRFNNGSVLRVSDSFRGGTYQLLHISEAAKLARKYPKKAEEVRTGAIPAVPLSGIIFLESTTQGKVGFFWDICKLALDREAEGRPLHELAWKLHFFPWHAEPKYTLNPDAVVIPDRLKEYFERLRVNHGINLTPGQMAWYTANEQIFGSKMYQEYPSTFEEAFESIIEGTFYANEMLRVRQEGRIGFVPIERGVPVDTAWDLGMDGATAIWFIQEVGREIHCVHYLEDSGYGLEHYTGELHRLKQEKEWLYGNNYLPHDVKVRELTQTTGLDRRARLEELGVTVTVAPGPQEVSLADGIEQVKKALAYTFFSEEHCEKGIDCLDSYGREWDQERGIWKEIVAKSPYTHGADAFRMYVISRKPEILNAPTIERPARQRPARRARGYGM